MDHRKPRWPFYAGWLAAAATSMLLALAFYWAIIPLVVDVVGDQMLVAGRSRITEDFLLPFIFVPALGLANGLLQALLLRPYLPHPGRWITATALGWTLALAGSRALDNLTLAASLDINSLGPSMARIILTGGVIGLAQWWVLRRQVDRAAWWLAANWAGWTLSALFSPWLDLWVLAVPAIATAVGLWLLLDRLSAQARAANLSP